MNLIISSVYGLAWFLVKRLPNKITLKIFRKIADYSYRKDIKGVQQLRANLSFMLNLNQNSIELEKIVKEGMRSYLRYWQEAFHLPKWDKNYLEKNIRVKGMINLASFYWQQNQLLIAKQWFEFALKIDPMNVMARHGYESLQQIEDGYERNTEMNKKSYEISEKLE